MTQRSPTSNGCITYTNMIASNMVFHMFLKIKPANRSCEERTRSTFIVAISNKRSHSIMITTTRIPDISLFNCFTAVLVSLKHEQELSSLCKFSPTQVKPREYSTFLCQSKYFLEIKTNFPLSALHFPLIFYFLFLDYQTLIQPN